MKYEDLIPGQVWRVSNLNSSYDGFTMWVVAIHENRFTVHYYEANDETLMLYRVMSKAGWNEWEYEKMGWELVEKSFKESLVLYLFDAYKVTDLRKQK